MDGVPGEPPANGVTLTVFSNGNMFYQENTHSKVFVIPICVLLAIALLLVYIGGLADILSKFRSQRAFPVAHFAYFNRYLADWLCVCLPRNPCLPCIDEDPGSGLRHWKS